MTYSDENDEEARVLERYVRQSFPHAGDEPSRDVPTPGRQSAPSDDDDDDEDAIIAGFVKQHFPR